MTTIDLEAVERNTRDGNYLPEQLPPMLLALLARCRTLAGALDLACERIELASRTADESFTKRMRAVLRRQLVQHGDGYAWVDPPDGWAIESHQKHVNGQHLIMAHAVTHVHADVTLLPNRATVIFAGPGRKPHIALLHAHAAILECADEMAAAAPPGIEASTYVLQVAGARAWEVLRPVFGDAYAGAVL